MGLGATRGGPWTVACPEPRPRIPPLTPTAPGTEPKRPVDLSLSPLTGPTALELVLLVLRLLIFPARGLPMVPEPAAAMA